jgi:transposase
LALVVDEEQGLPLYDRCDEGNPPDVVALGASLAGMLGPFCPQHASPHLTLILDQGHVSRDNFQALAQAHFSCLAAIPAGWVRQLSQGSLKTYQPLSLPDGRRGKVYAQPQARLVGIAGKLLVSFRPRFYRRQVRTLDLLQRKADQKLRTLQATIQEAVARHRPRTEQAVRRERSRGLRHARLKDLCSPTLQRHHGAVEALSWEGDRRKKRAIKHGTFGRTVLFTDRRELSDQRIVVAYRSQAKGEEMFRISKSRRPGVWWPAYHWTESTLLVHALYCFLALLLMRIVLLRLQERHLALGVDLLLERLRGMQEALVVYANGAAPRVLTQRSPEQEELFVALNLRPLAEPLGNTVLDL